MHLITIHYSKLDINCLFIYLIFIHCELYHSVYNMNDKGPSGGPLCDPTTPYYIKSADNGPLTIMKFLQDCQNYYP